jgi:hypothetical protein
LDSPGGDTAANRNKLAQQQAVYKSFMAAAMNNGENTMSDSQLNSFKNQFNRATTGADTPKTTPKQQPSGGGGSSGGDDDAPPSGDDSDIPSGEVDPEVEEAKKEQERAKAQGDFKRSLQSEINATREAINNGANTKENLDKLAELQNLQRDYIIAQNEAGEDLIPESKMNRFKDRMSGITGKPANKDKAANTDTSKQSNPSSTGGESQAGQEPPPDPAANLTDFERVGLIEDRHLAVGDPADFARKVPGEEAPPDYIAGTLADGMNYMVNVESQRQTSKAVKSQAGQGFVNRSIPDYEDKTYFDQIVEMAFETSGAGSYETQLAQVFSRHDRFGKSLVTKNTVLSGYTFFTRPRLCLRDWNICADRKLAHLVTNDNQSIPYAIRCLLDTSFGLEDKNAASCPLYDLGNPFLVPLCNAVRSVSGFNDPMLATETTEGGFFSEDQTYVIGGDRMSRTYDINCSFRDYPGSPILAIIDAWCQYMAGLTDGSLQQYTDAIDLNRMDYTVSIYRFLMDRTNRNIVRWSKCTGCFPVSPPSGVVFNLNENEYTVDAASSINVPFKANRIEYDDPVILKEFNMLVRRYAGKEAGLVSGGKPKAFSHNHASNNFSGIPYIRISPIGYGYELVWLKRDKVGEYIFNSNSIGTLEGIFRTRAPEGNQGDYERDSLTYML